jgi:hypothetical protein
MPTSVPLTVRKRYPLPPRALAPPSRALADRAAIAARGGPLMAPTPAATPHSLISIRFASVCIPRLFLEPSPSPPTFRSHARDAGVVLDRTASDHLPLSRPHLELLQTQTTRSVHRSRRTTLPACSSRAITAVQYLGGSPRGTFPSKHSSQPQNASAGHHSPAQPLSH